METLGFDGLGRGGIRVPGGALRAANYVPGTYTEVQVGVGSGCQGGARGGGVQNIIHDVCSTRYAIRGRREEWGVDHFRLDFSTKLRMWPFYTEIRLGHTLRYIKIRAWPKTRGSLTPSGGTPFKE